jgi:hypothetical protein
MPDYSSLHLFGYVCYVLLAPHERTKLIAQSVECVFLGYSAEHKGYHCWNSVARRMQTSWDVVFNKSRHFYLRPTTYASAFLIDPLSFLHFPNAPPASLFIPRSTLSSSMSSSESPPVVPDYTVKPPVTQFYSHHGARLLDAPASSDAISSDVSFSSFIEDVPSSPHVEPSSSTDSSPKQLVRPSHRLHRLPGCYSPSTFTATYREAILHLEWQHAMAKEIAALERTGTWDHVPCPPSPPPAPTCLSDHL